MVFGTNWSCNKSRRKNQKDWTTKNCEEFLELKAMGFSDRRLTKLSNLTEKEVRNIRNDLGVHAVYKRVDSCAAEFESVTSYMYSTYSF